MTGRTSINITGNTVHHNVDDSDDQFNILADASLLLRGVDVLTDDAIVGTGLVRVSGQTAIDDSLTLDDAVTFANAGFVTQNDTNLTIGLTSSDAATVRNEAGATWQLVNNAQITGAGASEFVNRGLLEQTGGLGGGSTGGTSIIDTNFIDRGGEILIYGTVEFQSAVNRFVNAEIVGTNGDTFYLSDGLLDGDTVSVSNVDLLNARIAGDVFIGAENFFSDHLNLGAGAVLTLDSLTDRLELGEIIGSGEIDIKGDDSQVGADDLVLAGAVTLDNYGNTTFDGSFNLSGLGTRITATASEGDQITIENHAGATWTDTNAFATFTSDSGTSATFYNNGEFRDFTISGTSFDMDVVNNGVMEAGPWVTFEDVPLYGGYAFADAVTGTGTIEIGFDPVAALALVGGGQTLEFTPVPSGVPNPTLTLNDVQEFSGLITGFDQNGATTDQLIVNSATWHYQDFVANGGGTGGSLMFTNGSAETAVNLSGSYDPTGFVGVGSGSQTTITYTG